MLNNRDLADLEAAVAEDPANGLARRGLAQALLNAGQSEGALAHARILLTSAPQDPVVLGLAAMAADLVGDHHAALAFGANLRAVLNAATDGTAAQAALPRPRNTEDVERWSSARSFVEGQAISLLTFADVSGLFDDRRRLDDVVIRPWREALQQRSIASRAQASSGRANSAPPGVLLYGAPSSGKRFLGRVAAGELGLRTVELDLADVVDPWGEPGPSKILRAFEDAQTNGPAVVILANLEVVTHRRLRYTANGRKVLTDLLAALDARDASTVFVLATSSAPWLVQPILRAPGRCSEAVLVGPPDQAARTFLIQRSLRRRSISNDVDASELSGLLQGCTVSDIENVLDCAVARAYSDSTALGRVTRVQSAHVERALRSARRGANVWFDTAYNFPEFTDDSSQFDPLFDYIRRHVRRS